MNASLKTTALLATHEKLKARLVEFGGWRMPVQYTSIAEEHKAVRETCGLFDISHMGEFFASGPQAATFLDSLLTNDVMALEIGRGQYTLMTNPQGGVIDDLLLYRLGPSEFLLIVNASKIDEDLAWMQSQLTAFLAKNGLAADQAVLVNKSDSLSAVALQGPKAIAVAELLLGPQWTKQKPTRNGIGVASWNCQEITVARTGYTGEDGVELVFANEIAGGLFLDILRVGQPLGILPAGLGARDTLRLEAGLPLNGNDLSPTRTPVSAGLRVFVSNKAGKDFPGKAVLDAELSAGSSEVLTGFVVADGPPPRAHYRILDMAGVQVSEVASGAPSPTLGYGIGMAYLPKALSVPGTELQLDVRGRLIPIKTVKKPFYKRSK